MASRIHYVSYRSPFNLRYRTVRHVTVVFGSLVTPLNTSVMVKVEIVEDRDVPGASPYSSPSSSRTSSSCSFSSLDSEASVDESLFDRITALKDIVPPTTRHNISTRVLKTASFLKRASKVVGNVVWVVTTSALLVGLPLALALEDEAKIVQQEKEMLEQQQGAQQVCSSILFALVEVLRIALQMMSPSLYPQPTELSQPKALVPPGF